MICPARSYGKTGYNLRALGQSVAASIAANRTSPIPAAYPTLPFVLSEVATHTTGTFDGLASNYDTGYEAARLGGQIAAQAISGFDTYIFKVCAIPGRPRCPRLSD